MDLALLKVGNLAPGQLCRSPHLVGRSSGVRGSGMASRAAMTRNRFHLHHIPRNSALLTQGPAQSLFLDALGAKVAVEVRCSDKDRERCGVKPRGSLPGAEDPTFLLADLAGSGDEDTREAARRVWDEAHPGALVVCVLGSSGEGPGTAYLALKAR